MTLTALITLNAILGACVVYGLVHLLAFGIQVDRKQHVRADVRALRERSSDRAAA
jgi:hypothetical protein